MLQLRLLEGEWKWIEGSDIKGLPEKSQFSVYETCDTPEHCKSHTKSFCKKREISEAGTCKACNDQNVNQNEQNMRCKHIPKPANICLIGKCTVMVRNTPYNFIENNNGGNSWSHQGPGSDFADKPITYYKLNVGNEEPLYYDRCNVNNQNQPIRNTIPLVPNNELEDSKPLTRAAMKMLDRLVSNNWADFKRQCIAIAKVKASETEEVHLIIAGNLDGTFLGQARTQQDIEKDMLHILFNEEKIEFPRSVKVLNSQEQTAGGPPESGFSHKHAEMQILKHCQKTNMKIVSLHVTKPPCCACNKKLDLAMTEIDRSITAPFVDPQIPRVFSGPSSTTCGTRQGHTQNNPCGHQFFLPGRGWKDPWIERLFKEPEFTVIYPRT